MTAESPVARPGLSASAVAALTADDRRIVITGASGWLGSATIELLHGALGDALHRRLRCFGSNARRLHLRDGLAVEQRPLEEIGSLDRHATSVLHLAFLTKDRVAGMDADAYETANAALSATVRDALDGIGAEAVFVASSGAARSAADPAAAHAMRLYGAMKQRDEELFGAWARERDRTAVITRVFNVAGPYINKHGDYALAAFINDALAGREIVVKAPHRVVRGFVAVRELMSLVFCLLGAEPPAVYRFDTGGEAMELGDVAAAVAAALNAPGVARAAITSERVDHYVGGATEYDRLRARFAIGAVPFADQVRETAEFMAAAKRLEGSSGSLPD